MAYRPLLASANKACLSLKGLRPESEPDRSGLEPFIFIHSNDEDQCSVTLEVLTCLVSNDGAGASHVSVSSQGKSQTASLRMPRSRSCLSSYCICFCPSILIQLIVLIHPILTARLLQTLILGVANFPPFSLSFSLFSL